jgi:hypothetical protein
LDAAALAFIFTGHDGEASDDGDAVPSLEPLPESLKARRMDDDDGSTCVPFLRLAIFGSDAGPIRTAGASSRQCRP